MANQKTHSTQIDLYGQNRNLINSLKPDIKKKLSGFDDAIITAQVFEADKLLTAIKNDIPESLYYQKGAQIIDSINNIIYSLNENGYFDDKIQKNLIKHLRSIQEKYIPALPDEIELKIARKKLEKGELIPIEKLKELAKAEERFEADKWNKEKMDEIIEMRIKLINNALTRAVNSAKEFYEKRVQALDNFKGIIDNNPSKKQLLFLNDMIKSKFLSQETPIGKIFLDTMAELLPDITDQKLKASFEKSQKALLKWFSKLAKAKLKDIKAGPFGKMKNNLLALQKELFPFVNDDPSIMAIFSEINDEIYTLENIDNLRKKVLENDDK